MERILSFFSFSSEIALSDIISVIALFLSLISTFIVCYRECFSVSVECTKILINFDNQFSPPTFELMILNRSTLPISIKKQSFAPESSIFLLIQRRATSLTIIKMLPATFFSFAKLQPASPLSLTVCPLCQLFSNGKRLVVYLCKNSAHYLDVFIFILRERKFTKPERSA